jgi:hypothetical protein
MSYTATFVAAEIRKAMAWPAVPPASADIISANVDVANAQVVERVENVSFYRAYLMPLKHLG